MGESLVAIQERGDSIVSLIMQDAKNNNKFTPEFVEVLVNALNTVISYKPKVMILQGLPEIFSAGATLETLLDICDEITTVRECLIPDALLNLPFPVIAAMEGHALGGGFVMALYCDVLIMARESRYGAGFITLGITPGLGCTGLLSHLLGPYIASEMMFTGRNFRGSELAERATGINRILPRSSVLSEAFDIARSIASNKIECLYLLKQELAGQKRQALEQARRSEDRMHSQCLLDKGLRNTIQERYLR